MKKLILTIAALIVTGGIASAQDSGPGSCPPPGPGGPVYGGYYGPGFGVPTPSVGGFGFGFFGGGGIFSNHAGPFGGGRRGRDRGPQNVQVLPIATTGQVVFPQNPFVRSPRDYFMYESR